MLPVFAVMVSIPLVLNFLATRRDFERHMDALLGASMLCVFWALTTIFAGLWDFPESKKFHSLIDLIGLLAATAMYATQRRVWKVALATLFMAQLIIHALYWSVYGGPTSGSIARGYILTLNITWVAQLLCVAYPGGSVVLRSALDWVRRHRGLGPLGRA